MTELGDGAMVGRFHFTDLCGKSRGRAEYAAVATKSAAFEMAMQFIVPPLSAFAGQPPYLFSFRV